jgi:outer membrane murein-binding lipoprotein Lpp
MVVRACVRVSGTVAHMRMLSFAVAVSTLSLALAGCVTTSHDNEAHTPEQTIMVSIQIYPGGDTSAMTPPSGR